MIRLTENFTLDGPDGLARGVTSPIPPHVMRHIREMAELAQIVRHLVRAPMRVTNGYDAPDVPDPPGRVPSSQHKDGTAIDFIPIGISQLEFYKRFTAAEKAGLIPDYGELIFYPFKLPIGKGSHGHIHLSLPTRKERREKLVRINENDNRGQMYAVLSPSWLQKFPGAAAATIAVIVIALLAYLLLFAPEISRHG